jgi:hypothetical protein
VSLLFPVKLVNIVAYFTSKGSPPIAPIEDFREFFYILLTDEWRLVSGDPGSGWQERIKNIADAALEFLQRRTPVRTSVEDDEPPVYSLSDIFAGNESIISDLTHELHDIFSLFVLGIATREHDNAISSFLYALSQKKYFGSVLLLYPDNYDNGDLDFFTPFPGASAICRYPDRWPGVLFWTKERDSTFLPLDAANRFVDHILPDMLEQANLDLGRAEELLQLRSMPTRRVCILHLSDLHFGTRYARRNQMYLLTCIKKANDRFDKIVVTGDLFDSPWKPKWQSFDAFRSNLNLLAGKEPILIPGNHDYKFLGNSLGGIGKSYRFIGQLGVEPIKCDPLLECVFFCFDSAKKGNFARGEVLAEDLVRMGQIYNELAIRNPNIESWLRVGLVHHHPYSFQIPSEGTTSKALEVMGIPEGKLLDMDESERFLQWCADRGLQLVLHGHRHVQRKKEKLIPTAGKELQVTAVGCGTSLGAEGREMTFNLLTWDSQKQRWSVSFFRDRFGGGFQEMRSFSVPVDPLAHKGAVF